MIRLLDVAGQPVLFRRALFGYEIIVFMGRDRFSVELGRIPHHRLGW